MAVLLDDTENAVGLEVEHTGPATIVVRGVFDKGVVDIYMNLNADAPSINICRLRYPGVFTVDAVGTYLLQAIFSGADVTDDTLININTIQ